MRDGEEGVGGGIGRPGGGLDEGTVKRVWEVGLGVLGTDGWLRDGEEGVVRWDWAS